MINDIAAVAIKAIRERDIFTTKNIGNRLGKWFDESQLDEFLSRLQPALTDEDGIWFTYVLNNYFVFKDIGRNDDET